VTRKVAHSVKYQEPALFWPIVFLLKHEPWISKILHPIEEKQVNFRLWITDDSSMLKKLNKIRRKVSTNGLSCIAECIKPSLTGRFERLYAAT
jgi:hypothetical protein